MAKTKCRTQRKIPITKIDVHVSGAVTIPKAKLQAIMDDIDSRFPDNCGQYMIEDIINTAIDNGWGELFVQENDLHACSSIHSDRPLTAEEVSAL